jgi:hypothetical protein
MDLDGVGGKSARLKGWALKSRLFWAQMANGRALVMDFPPSKSIRPAQYKQQVH